MEEEITTSSVTLPIRLSVPTSDVSTTKTVGKWSGQRLGTDFSVQMLLTHNSLRKLSARKINKFIFLSYSGINSATYRCTSCLTRFSMKFLFLFFQCYLKRFLNIRAYSWNVTAKADTHQSQTSISQRKKANKQTSKQKKNETLLLPARVTSRRF